MIKRKIALDTETTGINKFNIYYLNHKIIEIGAVEIIDRNITKNIFHEYINPNRYISSEAYNVHGINNEYLKNKPSFKEICNKFINFIYGSELIIHNSKFDIDFINYELNLINHKIKDIRKICNIIDTLKIARNKFPYKKNSLDSLCKRYKIEKKILHGALSDSKALAKVFLLLTGGQREISLVFNKENINKNNLFKKINKNEKFLNTKIIYANNCEINEHKKMLQYIEKKYRVDLSEKI